MLLPGFPIPILGATNKPLIVASRTFGQSSSSSGSRSVNVSYPVGTQPGDLVIALASASGNATLSTINYRTIIPPEGWAPVTSSGAARGIQTSTGEVGWHSMMRVAQPSDSAFQFSATNSHRLNVTLVTVRNAGLPLDAVSHGTATNLGTLPGLTVSSSIATLLLMGAFSNSTTTEPSITGPSSATELLNYTQNSGHPGGLVNWMGYEEDVGAGATGSRVWGENSASNVLAMLAIAAGTPSPWLYDKKIFTAPQSWQVPDGVTSVNILCVGSGGHGRAGSFGGQGGGGACAYSNNVPVTPLETLDVGVGVSLGENSHNTDACASYVRRGGVNLVLADYGKPAVRDPLSFPDVSIPGSGGAAANSIGDSLFSGTGGNSSTNNGGHAGMPFSHPISTTNMGRGLNTGSLSSLVMTATEGGHGAGSYQTSSDSVPGSDGVVIITWGLNRGFGGRFI